MPAETLRGHMIAVDIGPPRQPASLAVIDVHDDRDDPRWRVNSADILDARSPVEARTTVVELLTQVLPLRQRDQRHYVLVANGAGRTSVAAWRSMFVEHGCPVGHVVTVAGYPNEPTPHRAILRQDLASDITEAAAAGHITYPQTVGDALANWTGEPDADTGAAYRITPDDMLILPVAAAIYLLATPPVRISSPAAVSMGELGTDWQIRAAQAEVAAIQRGQTPRPTGADRYIRTVFGRSL